MQFSTSLQQVLSLTGLLSILTLTGLEIILSIDNVIFIALITDKLPVHQRPKARFIGLFIALLIRSILLLSIKWLMGFSIVLFTLFSLNVSLRDIVFFGGGFFLLIKTVSEIRNKIIGNETDPIIRQSPSKITAVIIQIIAIDILFSFDSLFTAISLVNNPLIIIGALVVSMSVMLLSSQIISEFLNRNPPIKMLALYFLVIISVFLIAESLHVNTDFYKPYIYVAMTFSVLVELINKQINKKPN